MINKTLLDSNSIGLSLRELAKKIARHGNIGASERLRLLSEAVEKKGPEAQMWANVDISKVIDADSIIEYYKLRHTTTRGCLLELVEAFRNILIFTPIIVTWLSLSQATAKYSEYISAAQARHDATALAQPFLFLWQQGFDGRLSGILTLGNIALIDVFLLVAIILLTFIAHAIASTNRLTEENKASELHTELIHAIGRANLCLHEKSVGGGSGSTVDTNQVVTDIRNMASQVVQTFDQLEKDLMTRFDGVINALARQLNQITNDLSGQLVKGGQYLNTMGNVATSLDKVGQNMLNAAQNLTNANQAMTKSLNDLLAPATTLASQQQQLLTAITDALKLLQTNTTLQKDNAQALQQITNQLTSWSSNFTTALDAVRDAANKMDGLVTQIGQFSTKQSDLIATLQHEHISQTKLADTMMQALLSTQDLQRTFEKLALDFRQIATDTNDVLRLYAGLPKNLTTDIATAVKNISESGNDFKSAAMSMYNVLSHFEQVVVAQEQVIDKLKASGVI